MRYKRIRDEEVREKELGFGTKTEEGRKLRQEEGEVGKKMN